MTQFLMSCGNPTCVQQGTRKCTRCQHKRYCSRECQRAHWPAHKDRCQAAPPPLEVVQEQKEIRKRVSEILMLPRIKNALRMVYIMEGRNFIFLIKAKDLLAYDKSGNDNDFKYAKMLYSQLSPTDGWHEFMRREPHTSAEFVFMEVIEDEAGGHISRRSMRLVEPPWADTGAFAHVKGGSAASASPHHCFADSLLQTELLAHQVLRELAEPLAQKCPYCSETKTKTESESETKSKHPLPGKVPATLACGHLVHMECYLTAFKNNKRTCPRCHVVPVFQKTPDELEDARRKTQPVPDILPTLQLFTMNRGSHTLKNVSADTRLAEIHGQAVPWAGGPPERVRLLIMRERADLNKKLRDYPGVHLSGIHVRRD